MDHKPLVAGRGFALGAGQCVLFLGDGVQEDGEVFAHWEKALRHPLFGRGPRHHPGVLHGQGQQAGPHCAAHQEGLHAGRLGRRKCGVRFTVPGERGMSSSMNPFTKVVFKLQCHSMFELKQTETFRKWRVRLKDARALAVIASRLDRLAFGLAGDAEPVGHGISELRIHHGPGYRVYFQKRGTTIIVLLCGGDKSTQAKDIKTAQRLALEWSE